MGEEFGEKTEAATPRRRQEAREQGNIARSADLTSAAVIVGMMLLLNWQGRSVVATLKRLMLEMLGDASLVNSSTIGMAQGMAQAVVQVGRAMAPLLLGVMGVAV